MLNKERIEAQRRRFNAMRRDGWDTTEAIALCDQALMVPRLVECLDSLQACSQSVMEGHGEGVKNSLRIDIECAIKSARRLLAEIGADK